MKLLWFFSLGSDPKSCPGLTNPFPKPSRFSANARLRTCLTTKSAAVSPCLPRPLTLYTANDVRLRFWVAALKRGQTLSASGFMTPRTRLRRESNPGSVSTFSPSPDPRWRSPRHLLIGQCDPGGGSRTRTYDLQLMRLTSCQLLHPAIEEGFSLGRRKYLQTLARNEQVIGVYCGFSPQNPATRPHEIRNWETSFLECLRHSW